mgnify:CR=1 FL=1
MIELLGTFAIASVIAAVVKDMGIWFFVVVVVGTAIITWMQWRFGTTFNAIKEQNRMQREMKLQARENCRKAMQMMRDANALTSVPRFLKD